MKYAVLTASLLACLTPALAGATNNDNGDANATATASHAGNTTATNGNVTGTITGGAQSFNPTNTVGAITNSATGGQGGAGGAGGSSNISANGIGAKTLSPESNASASSTNINAPVANGGSVLGSGNSASESKSGAAVVGSGNSRSTSKSGAVAKTGDSKSKSAAEVGDVAPSQSILIEAPEQKLQAPGFGIQYAAPTAPCVVTHGFALSVPGGGGSIGSGTVDKGCERREWARMLGGENGLRVACSDPIVSDVVPACKAFKANAAPAAAEAPAKKAEVTVKGGRS